MVDTGALVGWVAGCARDCDSSPRGALELAAQIYATADTLFDKIWLNSTRPNGFPDRPPHYYRNLAEVRAALREDRLNGLDVVGVYARLICALACLDEVCNSARLFLQKRASDDGYCSPKKVALKKPLSGTVHVWRRPDSTWRKVAVAGVHRGPASTLTRLAMSWDRGQASVAPSVVPVKLNPGTRSHDLSAPEGFSIGLCPMIGAYTPVFTADDSGGGFTVDKLLQPQSELVNDIKATIRAAIGNNVKCLVFPELSVDLAARTEIVDDLSGWGSNNSLRSVVAGSYHDRGVSFPPYPHEAPMLPGFGKSGGAGKPLFSQGKPGSLTLPATAVRGAPVGASQIRELNAPTRQMHVLDTAGGRFSVLIASDADCPQMAAFARAARPDFLLMVAFARCPSQFLRVAEEFARDGISTFFVRAHGAVRLSSAEDGDDPVLAFVRLAIPDSFKSTHRQVPRRWRWRRSTGVEVSNDPVLSSNLNWQPVPPNLLPIAHLLSTAESPDCPMAMIFNVGAAFRCLGGLNE